MQTTTYIQTHPLTEAFEYLQHLLRLRLQQHFEAKAELPNVEGYEWLDRMEAAHPLKEFMHTHLLSHDECVLLLIALLPHLKPHFFDSIIERYLPEPGDFPQIGGTRGKQFRGFLPTGETALFLLGGNDMNKRLEIEELFEADHFFAKKNILYLETPPDREPQMCGRIMLSQAYIDRFTTGKVHRPKFSMDFPAQYIETQLEWEDLVLNQQTRNQIGELERWIKHGNELMNDWGMGRKLKQGYRALFHGPPGTGKTLTASLLGKYTGRDVYKIDLSMVVSKFIGETEKNLSKLFAQAENKDWILFFDEADALFGKRTNVRDAHDKYANQEVSYLLQRVENYNGLVILASNFKSNIDDAFVRRFQSIIYFPIPKTKERLILWQQAFPQAAQLSASVNLPLLAKKYELTAASIMNIVQYCCLCSLDQGGQAISMDDIVYAIKREYGKEGKML